MLKKGKLKVLDFGLGKLTEGNRVSSSDRLGGMCTVHYAAPEQLDRTGVDERTDVYALALILFEMVTGRHVFGDSPRVLPPRDIVRANQLFAEPDSLRDVLPGCPASLADLIGAALRKDKAERPRSTELLAGLRDARRAVRGIDRESVPRLEDEDSVDEERDDDSVPPPAPAVPPQETSVVRVIPQLITASLPPDQPPPDPTAAGNPAPAHKVVRTIKMAAPRAEDLAAARARVAAEAAQAMPHEAPGEVTSGGRSATLPPAPIASSVGAAAPLLVETRPAPLPPILSGRPQLVPSDQDDSAARASVELASRPTTPWKRRAPAQEGTPSLTPSPTNRGLSVGEQLARSTRIPLWAGPAFGVALTLGVFGVFKVTQKRAHDARGDTDAPAVIASVSATPIIVPAASQSSTEPPAEAAAPTTTAMPTASTANTIAAPASSTSAAPAAATPAAWAASPARRATPPVTTASSRGQTRKQKPEPEPYVARPKPETPPARNRLFGTEP